MIKATVLAPLVSVVVVAALGGVAAAQPAPKAPPAPAAGAPKTPPPATALPPTGAAPVTPAKPAPAKPAAAPVPMKTDEKAGANEPLHRGSHASIDVSAAEEAEALVLFRAGNDQLNNGLFPQAVEKYRAALGHWDHPAIHYNLALALINLDQPIEVYEHLNKAIAYDEGPIGKDKFDHAKEYLKLVSGQLADIEVSCDKPGARVAVDGKEVFIAPGKHTAKVRVGKHTFLADKEGYNARVTAPFIGPGETFRIELKLYTARELTRYRRRWDNSWFPYVVIGGGLAAGLAGGAMQLSAQSSYDEFNARVLACNTETMGCSADNSDITKLRDSGDSKRVMGYVGYGVAGAAVVTGAVLLWLNRQEAYQISADQLNEPAAPIAIAPLVAPDLAGAMIHGSF